MGTLAVFFYYRLFNYVSLLHVQCIICVSTTLLLIVIQPWTVFFAAIIIPVVVHTYISQVRYLKKIAFLLHNHSLRTDAAANGA